jgi:hypothetical protein
VWLQPNTYLNTCPRNYAKSRLMLATTKLGYDVYASKIFFAPRTRSGGDMLGAGRIVGSSACQANRWLSAGLIHRRWSKLVSMNPGMGTRTDVPVWTASDGPPRNTDEPPAFVVACHRRWSNLSLAVPTCTCAYLCTCCRALVLPSSRYCRQPVT